MQHLDDRALYAYRGNTRGLAVAIGSYLRALPAGFLTFTEMEEHARGAEDDFHPGHCAIESHAYGHR